MNNPMTACPVAKTDGSPFTLVEVMSIVVRGNAQFKSAIILRYYLS